MRAPDFVFALTIPEEDDAAGVRGVQHARRHFKGLRDPRRRRGKRHRLVDVVLISLLAMLCGCDDADDIADWAELRSDLLARWFDLKHGTPSQDTVLRVFEVLAPSAFSAAVMSWLASLGSPQRGLSSGSMAASAAVGLPRCVFWTIEFAGSHFVRACQSSWAR